MKRSPMTMLTRAFFVLGAALVTAFLFSVGPYLAGQTAKIWMAFGAGLALIAYGRTSARRQWVGVSCIAIGTLWLAALIFAIFGIADL